MCIVPHIGWPPSLLPQAPYCSANGFLQHNRYTIDCEEFGFSSSLTPITTQYAPDRKTMHKCATPKPTKHLADICRLVAPLSQDLTLEPFARPNTKPLTDLMSQILVVYGGGKKANGLGANGDSTIANIECAKLKAAIRKAPSAAGTRKSLADLRKRAATSTPTAILYTLKHILHQIRRRTLRPANLLNASLTLFIFLPHHSAFPDEAGVYTSPS
ncbi:hypothetical protein BDV97DRAFT_394262 [Delphinella strobiligena]|nr:hypothetical protein BDV97DRAFT_394262 [Delphinella strobiligena]